MVNTNKTEGEFFENVTSLETTRNAFRVNHGFDLFNSHPIIVESTNENLSEAFFRLMTIVSQDDGRNRTSIFVITV